MERDEPTKCRQSSPGCRHFMVARNRGDELMSALETAMPAIGNPPGTVQLDRERLRNAGLGVYFRPHQIDELGMTYDQLRRLVSTGAVEHVARGLYRLAGEEPTEHETIAACARAFPMPSSVCYGAWRIRDRDSASARGLDRDPPQGQTAAAAIPHPSRSLQRRRVELRRARYPIRWRSGAHDLTARTVVDCFRFERLIGREAALEAVHDALRQRIVTTDELTRALDVFPSRLLSAALEVRSL